MAHSMKSRPKRSFAAKLAIRIPYAWLIAFFLVPFLIALKISFSHTVIAQPPYTPVLDFSAGWQGIRSFFAAFSPYTPVLDLSAGWQGVRSFFAGFSLDNYVLLGADPLYLLSLLKSLQIAAVSTAILLVIGYPIAYGISRMPRRVQAVLVLLVALPFWTSFLIRIYAWMNILQHDGPLNQVLMALHVLREPRVWLATDTAIYIGIVYSYLPFMVLPLYATLEKLDQTLLEAAADLGCTRGRAFWRVTLPLSAPGVLAGALLCFIPIIGEFVIPDLLGGSQSPMIGQTIWTEFFGNKDWPTAAAVAVALVAMLVTPIVIFQYLATRAPARGR